MMMPLSSCRSVVRIGCATTGTLIGVDSVEEVLLRALKSYFHAAANNNNLTSKNDSCLTISNRYFTACVSLQPLKNNKQQALDTVAGHPTSSAAALTTEMSETDHKNQQEDGILLIFWEEVPPTTHSMALFDELASLHDKAERDHQCGDLLRLCVRAHFGNNNNTSNSATSLLSPKQQEEEYARRILWCLDRGYEYVEADLSDQGQKVGHNLRDKDGFARIVEAFAGTVWSSAVMKSNAKQQLQTSYQQETENLTQLSHEVDHDINDKGSSIPATTESIPTKSISGISAEAPEIRASAEEDLPIGDIINPGDCSCPLNDDFKDADEKARKFLLDQIPRDEDLRDNNNSNQDSRLEEDITVQEDHEQENLLHNFEHALREATRIRELSKSGTLTDDERRQRAEDAANVLMGLLDQMGFDDDVDEEDLKSSNQSVAGKQQNS